MPQTKSKKPVLNQRRPAIRSKPDRTILLGAAFIIVATLIVYLPAIRSWYIWDDPQHITDNSNLRSLHGLAQIWTDPMSVPQWYPLVHTTFWIEYHLWALNPLGYHLDNVLLHITSALLLWRLLWKLKVPGAWLAGAIFALHPVQTESVAWITERKNVLSCVFYLLCLLSYFKRFHAGAERSAAPDGLGLSKASGAALRSAPAWRRIIVPLVLFIAALLSKSVTATLPAAILVILWWKNGTVRWRDVRPLIPLFIAGIGMGLYTAHLEVAHVGARSDRIVELSLSWADRIVLAGRVICFYASKLVFPWPLVFIYPQWKVDSGQWWQWSFLIGVVTLLAILLLARKRIGRGLAAMLLLYSGTLFPVLGFLNVYPFRFSYVADHFQYHATLAPIALAAAGLSLLPRGRGIIAGAILATFAILTCRQSTNYYDTETLWRRTLAKNPNSWMVNTNLALMLRERAEETNDPAVYAEMDALFARALALGPDIHDTHTNVGMELGRRGQYDAALREFEAALRINPNFAPAFYGMGEIYQKQKQYDQAMNCFDQAIKSQSTYWLAYLRMGMVLEELHNPAAAREYYAAAADGLPENFDAHYNLGNTCIALNQFPLAVAALQEAVRIRPDSAEAWNNFGYAQARAGDPRSAILSLKKALSINPNLQQAKILLQNLARTQPAN